MYSKISKYIPSIVTAVLGIVIFLIIPSQIDMSRVSNPEQHGIDSRTIPYFLALIIIFLSVLDLILKKIKPGIEVEKNIPVPFRSLLRVLLTIIGIFLWILTIPYLGFVIAMSLLLIFIMYLMGNRKWYLFLPIPILTSVILRYVFTEFVGRTLPSGIFF